MNRVLNDIFASPINAKTIILLPHPPAAIYGREKESDEADGFIQATDNKTLIGLFLLLLLLMTNEHQLNRFFFYFFFLPFSFSCRLEQQHPSEPVSLLSPPTPSPCYIDWFHLVFFLSFFLYPPTPRRLRDYRIHILGRVESNAFSHLEEDDGISLLSHRKNSTEREISPRSTQRSSVQQQYENDYT